MAEPILCVGVDFSTDMAKWEVWDANDGDGPVARNEHSFYEIYGSKYGLAPNSGFVERDDGGAYIPYGMVADVVGLVLEDIANRLGENRKFLKHIRFSLQQHGMAALTQDAVAVLQRAGTDSQTPLSQAGLGAMFSNDMATIWRHTGSKPDCDALVTKLSSDRFAQLTGSDPRRSARFMGAQIAYLHRTNPQAFANTGEFTVLAALVAMLLTGHSVGMGMDEASYTLLMNVSRGQWSSDTLRSIFPRGTFARLPKIVAPGAEVGTLWQYHARRHDLPEECKVGMGFGDNIAIMLTMANQPGMRGLSGGSSGTEYAEMSAAGWDRHHVGHVGRSATGGFMGLYCTDHCGKFADAVRMQAGMEWSEFNNDVAMPQWDDPEQMVLPDAKGQPRYFGSEPSAASVASAVARSIVADILEGGAFMGAPTSIVATGGFIRSGVEQIVADMAQVPVFVAPKMNRVVRGSVGMSIHQVTGKPIADVMARLCPAGSKVSPVAVRADFYRRFLDAYRGRK